MNPEAIAENIHTRMTEKLKTEPYESFQEKRDSLCSKKNQFDQQSRTKLNSLEKSGKYSSQKLFSNIALTKTSKRIEKIKQYKFIEKCFTDLQLEGMFNELEISQVPEARWPLIIIDKAYDKMKHQ